MLTLTTPTFLRPGGLLSDAGGPDTQALQQDPLLADGLRMLAAATRAEMFQGALAERLPLLRQQQAQVQELQAALWARVRAGGLPGTEQSRWVARLAQQLQLAVHAGFKRAAADGSAARGLFVRQRPTVEALALAMESGWQLASLHARSYTALPRGFWADCHRLFAYAAAQGFDDKAPGAGQPALGETYRRLLLLGVTGSNRYEADHIGMLLEVLVEQAAQLSVAPLAQARPPGQGAFVLHEDLDSPPMFSRDAPAGPAAGAGRALQLERVLQSLQRSIDAEQNAAVPSQRRLQLYQRLQQEWSAPSQRRHARRRHAGETRVELISTMAGCWERIERDHGQGAEPAWAQRFTEDADAAPTLPPPAAEEEAAAPALLAISNISDSGLLLQGESDSQALMSGELVAYRQLGKPWRLGLIRWVDFRVESLVTLCGIEYVGGAPEAVMFTPVTSQAGGAYQPALRLKGRNMVVVAGRYFQPFREFLLGDAQAVQRVRAVRLVLQSSRYQVMEFQMDGLE